MQMPIETDLLQLLFEEYKKAVGTYESETHVAKLVSGANQFIEFAREYLNNNRASRIFTHDNNVGVILTNNMRVIVSPDSVTEDVAGTMATVAGRAVPVTDDPENIRTFTDQGAIPITGFPKKLKNSIDYKSMTYKDKPIDKMATTSAVNFKSKAPVAVDPLNS